MSSNLQAPPGWGAHRSGRPLFPVPLTATFLRTRTCSLPWPTAYQRWKQLGRSPQVGGGHSKAGRGNPGPSTKTLIWEARIRGRGARQPNPALQRRRPLDASFSENQAEPDLIQVLTQSPAHCGASKIECGLSYRIPNSVPPQVSFPGPSSYSVDQGFVMLYLGLINPWAKPGIGGIGGHERACGAQRHWLDPALLRGISGLGLGLLCQVFCCHLCC